MNRQPVVREQGQLGSIHKAKHFCKKAHLTCPFSIMRQDSVYVLLIKVKCF